MIINSKIKESKSVLTGTKSDTKKAKIAIIDCMAKSVKLICLCVIPSFINLN